MNAPIKPAIVMQQQGHTGLLPTEQSIENVREVVDKGEWSAI